MHQRTQRNSLIRKHPSCQHINGSIVCCLERNKYRQAHAPALLCSFSALLDQELILLRVTVGCK